MKFKKFLLATILSLALGASSAMAKITINAPGYGTDVMISGGGAPANGPVEARVNGVWAGRGQADAAGQFQIPHLNLKSGDKVTVTASYTWNFNTDGDLEGWQVANANLSVSNGTLKFSPTAADAQMWNDSVNFPGGVYQVIDIRQKNPTTASSMQVYFKNDLHDFAEGSATNRTGIAPNVDAFLTAHWPVGYSDDGQTNTNVCDWTKGGQITRLRLDWDGPNEPTSGTVEIDYIRVSEYVEFDFNHDGDGEYFVPSAANANDVKDLKVANGALSYTVTDANGDGSVDPFIVGMGWQGNFSMGCFLDEGTFNTLDVKGKITSANNPVLGLYWCDKWIGTAKDADHLNDWAYEGNVLQNTLGPNDGSDFTTTIDLTNPDTTKGSWSAADNPLYWWAFRLDIPENATDGDQVSLDYVRLRPAVAYGPSDEATVGNQPGPSSPVTGWPLQAVKTSTPPTLDGVISPGEWTPAGPVEVDLNAANLTAQDRYFTNYIHNGGRVPTGGNEVTSDADLSGKLYFLWDANALYLAADITDDELLPNSGASVNGGDAYQPCIDWDQLQAADSQAADAKVYIPSFAAQTNTGTASANNDDQYQHQFWPISAPKPMTGMTWATKTSSTGYVVEVKIPWSAFTAGGATFSKPMPPAEGQTCGMLPILDDHDTIDGTPQASFMETEGGDGNFVVTQANNYGTLTFTSNPTLPVNAARDWEVFE